jgi:hypothetical protein
MTALLPPGFAALEPFASGWAGESAAMRACIRDQAGVEELNAFYEAVQPLVGTALASLDTRPLAEQDEREMRLMRLLLTFAHVAMAVEVQREDEQVHAGLRAHLSILHAPADAPFRRREVAGR